MNNPLLKNILTRRSVRSYTKKQITKDDLNEILLAGSYAPSGMGLQSWKFTAIQSPQVLNEVNEAIRIALLNIPKSNIPNDFIKGLVEKAEDENSNFLYNAPTYVIVSNLKDNPNSMADTALAIGNMMLVANSLGIGSCWVNQIASFEKAPSIQKLMKKLNIPDNHKIFGSVVLGYAQGDIRPATPRKDIINIL